MLGVGVNQKEEGMHDGAVGVERKAPTVDASSFRSIKMKCTIKDTKGAAAVGLFAAEKTDSGSRFVESRVRFSYAFYDVIRV